MTCEEGVECIKLFMRVILLDSFMHLTLALAVDNRSKPLLRHLIILNNLKNLSPGTVSQDW